MSGLKTGDEYPGPIEPAEDYRFRQRAGGVIAKRVRGGEVFARGPGASRVVAALREISHGQRPISKIYVNHLGHVFWRDEGKPRLIAVLNEQLEFPTEA